jgi:acetyl esterase/lipase
MSTMRTQRLPIRDDGQAVYLDTYLLQNSPEYQTDTRRPAVIICPGGGYLFTSDREAEPVALRFLAQDHHALVLRYSV